LIQDKPITWLVFYATVAMYILYNTTYWHGHTWNSAIKFSDKTNQTMYAYFNQSLFIVELHSNEL